MYSMHCNIMQMITDIPDRKKTLSCLGLKHGFDLPDKA